MMRKHKLIIISVGLVFLVAGAVYGALTYYYDHMPFASNPPPADEGEVEITPASPEETGSESEGMIAAGDEKQDASSKPAAKPPESTDRYVGIKNGRVAVFLGKPQEGRVEQLTEITVDMLPQYEQENLRKGIRVNNQRELQLILEGLSES